MTPGVSIVVPVFNAERHLESAIRTVLDQDYPADRWEAIFVDNKSSDGSRALLERYSDRLRLFSAERRGASVARNVGIREARFDLIAFTDADCQPAKNWLRELVAAIESSDSADLVGGQIAALQSPTPILSFADTIMDQQSALGYDPPYVISANLLARRSLLFELGLFDENLPRGQDVDLSYRAHWHGASFAYAPRAVVQHVHPDTLGALWRKGLQHGRAAADVLRKHAVALGQTPGQRCRDRRAYAAILADARSGLAWAWRARKSGDPQALSCMQEKQCRAVFFAGRQVGLIRSTLSSRRSKQSPHGSNVL